MAQNVLSTEFQMYGIFSTGDPNETILRQVYNTYNVRRVIILDRNVYQRVLRRVQRLGLRDMRVENYHMDPGDSGQASAMKENVLSIIGSQPVLVACLHGQDRTGFLLAAWLIKSGRANPCGAIEKVKSVTGYGRGINEIQLNNYNMVLGCADKKADESSEDEEVTPEQAADIIGTSATLADTILKLAKKKQVIDVGKSLQVSPDVVEDLHDSIRRTLQGIKALKSDVEGMEISEVALEKIRDYAGNLSLLCNMMLNGKDYDEEEKLKAILDVTTNDVNDMTAVDQVRESYDMQGGLSQGARGDSGPAGDNLRYFNYIDPDAEVYPGGTVGTNIIARKRILKTLIRTGGKVLCQKCLRNPCDCGPECPLCNGKTDQDLKNDDLASHLQDKSAVIIKGNPKYTNTSVAKRFYSELEQFLIDLGFTVHVDDGSENSEPPAADVWIGHSRGIDKLVDAPPGTVTVKMGFPGEDDTINHPDDKSTAGGQISKAHFILTSRMMDQLKAKIGLGLVINKMKEDQNAAFLGGGPQGSPTAEALPSGVGALPSVGLHDNYTGTSSHMNQPSGAPGAPNGASPVMPAQPNLSS